MSVGLNKFIATAGGIGYLPLAPGTWASIVTAAIWFLVFKNHDNTVIQLIVTGLIIIAGIYFSGNTGNPADKDPSYVVIDEVAGMCITLLLIIPNYQNIIAGLIVFRILDILKPLGIKKMEVFGGGYGIMLDDILAGVYSNLILRVITLINLW